MTALGLTQESKALRSLRNVSRDRLKLWVQVPMIQTQQMAKPSQKCQTLLWEALPVDHILLQRVATLMSLQDNMTMESGLIQESKALRSLKNESRDKLKQWAQALMIQIELMVRQNQKCLTLQWEAHPVDLNLLLRVAMSMLLQDSMMMA